MLINIKRTFLTLLCIVHYALCVAQSFHEEWADSTFRTQIATEQLTDSTLADRLSYNLFKAKEYQLKGQINEAINLLVTNIELDSTVSHPELYATSSYLIYQILFEKEQYSEAFHFIKLAHQHNPNNDTYLLRLAEMEFGYQQYDLAIKHYKLLNKHQPYNSNYIQYLTQAYLQKNQYKKALKELDKFQHLEGHSVNLLSQRAEILLQNDKGKDAIKEATDYINNHPEDHLEASLLLANIYRATDNNDKNIELLHQLETRYPHDGSVYIALANSYKTAYNDSLNELYTLKAVKSNTFTAQYAVKLVRPILAGYIQNANTALIHPLLDTLNILYPHETPIIELRADLFKALNDTTSWRTTLYELRTIKNHDEALDFQLITLAESLRDTKEIYNLTKEGYNKFQNDQWAHFYIISLAQNEMHDSLFSESHRIIPTLTSSNTKSSIYQLLGDVYSSQNLDSLAMVMYDSCLYYNPDNSGALNNVAYNITKQPNPDLKKAEKMAAHALELDPESIYILDTYAWILFLRGDNFLSEFYFDKLLRVHQQQGSEPSIETLYHIGCLYIKTNRIEQAKTLWHKALDLYNANPDAFNEPEIITTIQTFFTDNQ